MTKSLGMRKSNSAISKSEEEEERSHLIPTELDLSILTHDSGSRVVLVETRRKVRTIVVHLIQTLIGKKKQIGSINSYMIRTL